MARVRMVTRTIMESSIEVMTVNTETATVENITVILSGEFTTDESLKAVKKVVENDTLKVVKVISIDTSEKLYGMPESEFIKLASVMPNR